MSFFVKTISPGIWTFSQKNDFHKLPIDYSIPTGNREIICVLCAASCAEAHAESSEYRKSLDMGGFGVWVVGWDVDC